MFRPLSHVLAWLRFDVRPAGFPPGHKTVGEVAAQPVEDEGEKEDAEGFHDGLAFLRLSESEIIEYDVTVLFCPHKESDQVGEHRAN